MGKPKTKIFDLCNEDVTDPKVRNLATRKKFHPHDLIKLQPLTKSQEQFLDAFNSDTPIILQSGSAGTGKTCLALYAALQQVFDSASPYDQVVIFRSAVETRKVGFLPGDINEKAEIYQLSYKGLASFLIEGFKDPYDHLKALGYLDFQLTSYQRGTTYDNCIMLIDECQNMDKSELLTILSRVGMNSRILLCGDSKQSDLERHREKSSFGYLKQLMLNMPYEVSKTIEYTVDDIVRSDLAREILIADSKIED